MEKPIDTRSITCYDVSMIHYFYTQKKDGKTMCNSNKIAKKIVDKVYNELPTGFAKKLTVRLARRLNKAACRKA